MAVKTLKPITSGQRFVTRSSFEDLTVSKPHRALSKGRKRSSGRNNLGRVTMRRRGGGHKRKYRMVDFRRDKVGVPARVATIEYDPNRSARIALLHYVDGEKRYIIAPLGVKVGDLLVSGPEASIRPGNAMPLDRIPVGTAVHNVELERGKGAKIARGAGASVQLMAKEGRFAQLRLPSGEVRLVPRECYATVGQVGNLDHENVRLGKAGKARWLGRRPKVRGVAMNPHDHPMGGGEGKAAGGRHPCSPSGVLAKGYRTRSTGRASDRLIVRRRYER